ncbi:response regulator transcription factor [Microbacterium sp.]|uniref:response regulator transcription factor n=1 Tax=Microbacterium sp. TaxID=51671 RepID=UPI0037C66F7B
MQSVLVVDDEVDLARLTRMRLESAGITAAECYDGVSALTFIRQHRPAVVILDWMMPGLDGLELVRLVREDDSVTHTRIILMTARVEAETHDDFAESHGLDLVLVKPVSRAVLIESVQAELRAAAHAA